MAADHAPVHPGQSFIGGEAAEAPAPKKGKGALIAGAIVAAVAAAGLVVFLSTRGKGGGEKEVPQAAAAPTSSPSLTPSPSPSPSPIASPSPAAIALPSKITVDIQGPPKGTEVWKGDTKLGTVPGKLEIDRGDEPITLELRKKGYKSREQTITPAKDLIVSVELTKASSRDRDRTDKSDKTDKDKDTKPDKDSIEDPFK
jgi:hypothetical protein